jgi:small GTP-binding protein
MTIWTALLSPNTVAMWSQHCCLHKCHVKGDMTMTRVYKLVITGAFNAGKTTFVNTLSDIDAVNTDRRTYRKSEAAIKPATTVALDYGRAQIGDDLQVHLFGTPGQARFDFMHDILAKGMHGFVFLVDSTDEGSFDRVAELLDLFKVRSQVPYLVVANKADLDGLSSKDVGERLKLSDKQIPVPCTAIDEASVRAVVKRLVTMIETDGENRSESRE